MIEDTSIISIIECTSCTRTEEVNHQIWQYVVSYVITVSGNDWLIIPQLLPQAFQVWLNVPLLTRWQKLPQPIYLYRFTIDYTEAVFWASPIYDCDYHRTLSPLLVLGGRLNKNLITDTAIYIRKYLSEYPNVGNCWRIQKQSLFSIAFCFYHYILMRMSI